MIFGGSDPSLYTGSFTYVPLIPITAYNPNITRQNLGFWQFKVDGISLKGLTICKRCQAVISIEALGLFGPPNQINQMNAKIFGPKYAKNETLKFKCDSINLKNLPSITINLNGVPFVLESKDYILFLGKNMCQSGLIPNIGFDLAIYDWVFGLQFINAYYTEFDAEKFR